MSTPVLDDLRKLSVEERIQLVQDLWDSIEEDAEMPPLSEAQREELSRRIADAKANPGVGRPWDEVKARLLAKR